MFGQILAVALLTARLGKKIVMGLASRLWQHTYTAMETNKILTHHLPDGYCRVPKDERLIHVHREIWHASQETTVRHSLFVITKSSSTQQCGNTKRAAGRKVIYVLCVEIVADTVLHSIREHSIRQPEPLHRAFHFPDFWSFLDMFKLVVSAYSPRLWNTNITTFWNSQSSFYTCSTQRYATC